MKKRRGAKLFAGLLAVLTAAVGGLEYNRIEVAAVLDESTAVKYGTFSLTNTVEDGTLFIGTYLIHMSAMTDEIYEKAQESAEDSGQYDTYYKSELADGAWFDISSAEGLSDITEAAEPAEDAELAELWVTYYVGSDGIVRSASDNASVSIFDQPSPYDLYRLPELEALRIQYDNTYTEETSGVKLYFHDKLKEFFELDLRNSVTEECDRQLAALQSVYDSLRQQEEEEQAEIVYSLMAKIDAKRRAEIFYQLMEADNSRLDHLQSVLSGSGYESGDYDSEQFVASTDLSDAVGTAMESCESAYITHSSNQLSDDGTVLGTAEYTLSMEILQKAENGNTAMGTELTKLKNLNSIRESMIRDKDAELKLLEQELIPKAKRKLENAFSSGAGQEYRTAVAQGKSKAACENLLMLQKTEQDKITTEYEFLIQAKAERLGSQDAADFLLGEIEDAGNLYDKIQDDAYAANAQSGVDSCLQKLQELTQGVIDGDSSMRSTLSALEAEKAEVQTKRDEALDDNNLSLAKKYDAMLDAIDVEIAAEEARLAGQLSSGSAVDRAKAMLQLGEKTESANIMKIKNNATAKLAEGDTDGVLEAADALAAMGAADALEELLSALPTDTSDSVKKALSDALSEAKENSGDGSGTGSGGETGDAALSLEELFGDGTEGLSAEDRAAAIGALLQLNGEGQAGAAELAGTFARQGMSEGNKYLFRKYTDASDGKYLSVQTIGKVTSYRYIYDITGRTAVLSHRGTTYHFQVGSGEVKLSDGSIEQMSAETVLQRGITYIPETAGSLYFGCTVLYVDGTDYAVCVTADLQDRIEQLLTDLGKGAE